jgi:hypothetical protein
VVAVAAMVLAQVRSPQEGAGMAVVTVTALARQWWW